MPIPNKSWRVVPQRCWNFGLEIAEQLSGERFLILALTDLPCPPVFVRVAVSSCEIAANSLDFGA